MVRVLWGLSCLSLPDPATATDVVREVRDAFALGDLPFEKSSPSCGSGAGSSDDSSGGEGRRAGATPRRAPPRVELYRLVPLAADEGAALSQDGCEKVVAVLPDAGLGCAELEEAWRRGDEEEARAARAGEALTEALAALGATGAAACCEEAVRALRQENRLLRRRLDQGDAVRRELQETVEVLRSEFVMLVQEVMPLLPAGGPDGAQSPAAGALGALGLPAAAAAGPPGLGAGGAGAPSRSGGPAGPGGLAVGALAGGCAARRGAGPMADEH